MARAYRSLIGLVFDRLTVVEEADRDNNNNICWRCVCICGIAKSVRGFSLLNGTTKSCGCLQRDLHAKTHGATYTPEYTIWKGMWSRCRGTNSKYYAKYKSRMPVDRWKSFKLFLQDMGPRPDPSLTLERVDNDKGYSPENCVWASRTDQNYNRCNTLYLTHNGVKKLMAVWAEEANMSVQKLKYRIRAGWPTDQALIPDNNLMYSTKVRILKIKE